MRRGIAADPGQLRKELVLEAPATAPDGAGGHIEIWSEAATMFGRVAPVAARRDVAGDQRMQPVSHRVTVRFRQDIRSGMRFVIGDRKLAILTVADPDETGRFLVCDTMEEGR